MTGRGSRRRSIQSTAKDKYSWKLFTYTWNGATPGAHTLVSRVTDVNGHVQPTAAGLENKKSFLEDNARSCERHDLRDQGLVIRG